MFGFGRRRNTHPLDAAEAAGRNPDDALRRDVQELARRLDRLEQLEWDARAKQLDAMEKVLRRLAGRVREREREAARVEPEADHNGSGDQEGAAPARPPVTPPYYTGRPADLARRFRGGL